MPRIKVAPAHVAPGADGYLPVPETDLDELQNITIAAGSAATSAATSSQVVTIHHTSGIEPIFARWDGAPAALNAGVPIHPGTRRDLNTGAAGVTLSLYSQAAAVATVEAYVEQ